MLGDIVISLETAVTGKYVCTFTEREIDFNSTFNVTFIGI